MDGKDIIGGSVPETDLKFSPTNNDATNSNGILSPPTTPSTATPSENDYNPNPSNSGRFKFYKDGKFILELWHHKNGERMFWIPVSKNSTCWPPVGHCTPRQESSTSLSVSDDNSSVQSSPWQRDHCWKQAVPRKNVNRELEFMMQILRPRRMRFSSAAIRKRRRRPYDPFIKCDVVVVAPAAKKLTSNRCSSSITTTTTTSVDDEIDHKPPFPLLPVKMELKSHLEPEPEQLVLSEARTPWRLNEVLKKLLDRRSHTDPGIVSPRKRILKEMEKVSLEEMGNVNKKHRARTVFSSSSCSGSSYSTAAVAPCNTVTVIAGGAAGAATTFGGLSTPVTAITAPMTTATATIKSTNSHSISSILSRDEEQPSFLRHLLKSPTDGCTSTGGVPVGELSPAASSSPVAGMDMRDVTARIARPAHCSTPIASSLASPSPPRPPSASASSCLSYPAAASKSLPPQPPPPLHPPPTLPPYIPPAYLYHSSPQPYLTSPPVSNHPPYYPAFAAAAAAAGFRDSSAVWSVPPLSSLGRQSVYPSAGLLSSYPGLNPSPWVPVAHTPLQSYPVAENGTDVPLNLSKH